MRKEMENRLINFTVDIYDMSKVLNNSFIARHLINQILRSSTGAALNFAEALSAESRKDFIHKNSIVLKELRESNVNLKIIARMKLCKDEKIIANTILESEELVSIFYRSIETAKKNGNEIIKGR